MAILDGPLPYLPHFFTSSRYSTSTEHVAAELTRTLVVAIQVCRIASRANKAEGLAHSLLITLVTFTDTAIIAFCSLVARPFSQFTGKLSKLAEQEKTTL